MCQMTCCLYKSVLECLLLSMGLSMLILWAMPRHQTDYYLSHKIKVYNRLSSTSFSSTCSATALSPPCHRPLLMCPPGLLALTALVRPACWPSPPRLVGHTCLAVTSSRDSHSPLGNKRHQPEASCFRSKQFRFRPQPNKEETVKTAGHNRSAMFPHPHEICRHDV